MATKSKFYSIADMFLSAHFKSSKLKYPNELRLTDNFYTRFKIKHWINNRPKPLNFLKSTWNYLARLYFYCTNSDIDSKLDLIDIKLDRPKGISHYDWLNFKYGNHYAKYVSSNHAKKQSILSTARNLNVETASVFKLGKKWYEDRNNLDGWYEQLRITKEKANKGETWHKVIRDKSTRQYWRNLNYQEDEIDSLILEYKRNHSLKSKEGILNSFKLKYGKDWKQKYTEFKKSQAECFKKSPKAYSSKQGTEIILKILKELSIETYKLEWFIRHKNNIYFYDCLIELNNKKFLIEFDGVAWHYTKNYESHYRGHIFGVSPEMSIKKDLIKTNLALSKGYVIIRINSELTFEESLDHVIRSINI